MSPDSEAGWLCALRGSPGYDGEMAVLTGHSKEEEVQTSGDLEQYTKWFEIMEMDFSLHHSVSGWTCIAMFRSGKKEEYVILGRTVPAVLNAMYGLIMQDVRNPF
jgi:hypothetical protein